MAIFLYVSSQLVRLVNAFSPDGGWFLIQIRFENFDVPNSIYNIVKTIYELLDSRIYDM